MRIYLIGYMASGKSNLGRLLAENLNYQILDLDQLFEQRYRISVLDFFEKYDEIVFRNMEHSLLLETFNVEDAVISTGGGTPCFFDNMELIKNAGISIYLRWELPALVQRLKTVRRKRPLLKDTAPNELEGKVATHLAQREVYYNQADYIIQGEDFELDKVLLMIRNLMNKVSP